MVMGLNDLAKETRARLTPGRPTMTAWLANCVVAARAHGVDIIDGVYNDIKDLDGFRAECLQGRDMGLDGKTLIHPSQIDICNEVFAPTAAEVESARAIIDAFALPENAGKGVIQLNGRMVELLHADMARRTLAIADAIAALSRGGRLSRRVRGERTRHVFRSNGAGPMGAEHHSLFPLGPDTTPYRKLTSEGVRVEKALGREILVVEPTALTRLAEQAMIDINHLLRPGHLAPARQDPRRPRGDRATTSSSPTIS